MALESSSGIITPRLDVELEDVAVGFAAAAMASAVTVEGNCRSHPHLRTVVTFVLTTIVTSIPTTLAWQWGCQRCRHKKKGETEFGETHCDTMSVC